MVRASYRRPEGCGLESLLGTQIFVWVKNSSKNIILTICTSELATIHLLTSIITYLIYSQTQKPSCAVKQVFWNEKYLVVPQKSSLKIKGKSQPT